MASRGEDWLRRVRVGRIDARMVAAGAGGLLARGLIDRPTRDLDYFTAPGDEKALSALRDAWSEGWRTMGSTTADNATSQRLCGSR
ncbi:MAG: hypothetical protein ACXW15_04485 [Acidimicrobiia bacterium]